MPVVCVHKVLISTIRADPSLNRRQNWISGINHFAQIDKLAKQSFAVTLIHQAFSLMLKQFVPLLKAPHC